MQPSRFLAPALLGTTAVAAVRAILWAVTQEETKLAESCESRAYSALNATFNSLKEKNDAWVDNINPFLGYLQFFDTASAPAEL